MKKVYDVIVAGAGPSGITASLSAARNGMNVLLIDKNAYPGGMNTAAMVSPLMTFHAGDKQVVKGIAQEIIDRLTEKKRDARPSSRSYRRSFYHYARRYGNAPPRLF